MAVPFEGFGPLAFVDLLCRHFCFECECECVSGKLMHVVLSH